MKRIPTTGKCDPNIALCVTSDLCVHTTLSSAANTGLLNPYGFAQ